MTYRPTQDPNYQSRLHGRENIAVKGRITMLIRAAQEAAFAGAQPPEYRATLEDELHICRQELENLIADRLRK